MEESKERLLDNTLKIINELIESIATFEVMKSLLSVYNNNSAFINLYNNNACIIIIRLCNIFGTNEEENHWKRLIPDEKLYKRDVIFKVFKNDDEWDEFWKNIVSFRNEYCVHYNYDSKGIMPYIQKIYLLIKETLVFLCNYYNLDPYYNDLKIDECFNDKKREAKSIFKRDRKSVV